MRYREQDDRRSKLIRVHPRDVARAFDAATRPVDFVDLPRFSDLPVGYTVDNVWFDQFSGSFVMALYHPSWPCLGETEQIPFVETPIDRVHLPRVPATVAGK